MINITEADERSHLEHVKHRLAVALDRLDGRVSRYAQDIRAQKTYIWEHKGDMDHVEKASARESVEQTMRSGEVAHAAKRRIQKLLQSPYFGRFDFRRNGDPALPVYVGIHSFADDEAGANLVFDWRAPISAMFYDFELGDAAYQSPAGDVRGEMTLKRQFRIRRGKMEFMLESGLNILDDVLQEELSRTSDDRMKNIVATIQRDQNAIIRNEDAEVLIIQGVAGSGKTSIALHRIAFLLYRFKDTLQAKDILILSPNKVFADFISNVLPELGEEPIAELGMEELADELLERKVRFQTQFEQSARLLEGDEGLSRRIQAKASAAFLGRLAEYAGHVEETRFTPADLEVADHVVPADFVAQAFRKRSDAPVAERIRWVAECVDHEAWVRWRRELSGKERAEVRAAVKKMCRNPSLRTLYREFFAWMGEPALFRTARGSTLEFSDVFPMIYLKLRLEREEGPYRHVKHLVVDEMQDYTPVQYAVLARLFPCNKTILGDVNQSINAWTASTAEAIAEVFRYSECVKLCKSYRSSYEITRFAQSISPSADLVAIERHGRKPRVVACRDRKAELAEIVQSVESFPQRGFQTMGIICRSPRQAERLFEALRAVVADVHLLSAGSTAFVRGVVVCSTHLAKGLEFDEVFVPHATQDEYVTPLDRNLLYVACTRAMHDLVLTHAGPLTSFVSDEALYERG